MGLAPSGKVMNTSQRAGFRSPAKGYRLILTCANQPAFSVSIVTLRLV